MTDLITLAAEIQEICETQNWEFCIIGGFGLQFWGEMRLTKDIDLTIFTDFGGEEIVISTLMKSYESRLPDAAAFALRNRVLLLRSAENIGIDVALGAFEFEKKMVSRAKYQEYLPEVFLKICSAEDLIITKSFANRDRDWVDIGSILMRQEKLEWNYIFEQLEPLVELKEEPEILAKLLKLREKK